MSILSAQYGITLIRSSRAEEGLAVLDELVGSKPESAGAWIALLSGLEESGKSNVVELLGDRIRDYCLELADDARFARFRARLAESQADWPTAIKEYQSAWVDQPNEFVNLFRLARAYRLAGNGYQREADTFEVLVAEFRQERETLKDLYQEADSVFNQSGRLPKFDDTLKSLFQRLAISRERMLRYEEAIAWHQLVLKERPEDLESLASIERLDRKIKERLPWAARMEDDEEKDSEAMGSND